jgi:anaerobic ribonucleoside-triphosphate reductase
MYEKVKSIEKENGKSLIINIEQIPAESMSHRLPNVDKAIFGKDKVPHELYANQFIPLWEDVSLWERIEKDGKFNKLITGGGIVHFSLGEKTTKAQNKKIIDHAVKTGCEHFALNPVYSKCVNDHTNFGDMESCPVCGGEIVSKVTRTIGYFSEVENWSTPKREYDFKRRRYKGIDE